MTTDIYSLPFPVGLWGFFFIIFSCCRAEIQGKYRGTDRERPFSGQKTTTNTIRKELNTMERTEFEYEIKQHIATLTEDEGAEYQKQLNIISWKGAKPSLDLRLWRITAEGQRPLKGLTLSADEAGRLYNALDVWKGQNDKPNE